MREDIIRICKEIKKNNNCSSCGGDFKNYTCRYCGSDSQVLATLINELCSSLVNLTSYDNDILNALYSIKSLNIKVVNDLLEQNNYAKILEDRFNKINGGVLSDEDYYYIVYFLDNNLFLGDNKNAYINFLMKKFLQNELSFSDEEILILIKHFVEMYMSLKVKNPKCIFNELDENTLGEALWTRIWLDKEKLLTFIHNKNYVLVLELIFHECTHCYQKYILTDDKEISYNVLLQAKEELLRCNVGNYYKENYFKFSSEVEARYCGALFTKQYLDSLGLVVNDNTYFNEVMNRELVLLTDDSRTINGVETTVDLAFSMYVVDASCLGKFPILGVQYKNNNGNLEMKTREEILNDYEKYKGDDNICIQTLYNYLLSSSKSKGVSM